MSSISAGADVLILALKNKQPPDSLLRSLSDSGLAPYVFDQAAFDTESLSKKTWGAVLFYGVDGYSVSRLNDIRKRGVNAYAVLAGPNDQETSLSSKACDDLRVVDLVQDTGSPVATTNSVVTAVAITQSEDLMCERLAETDRFLVEAEERLIKPGMKAKL